MGDENESVWEENGLGKDFFEGCMGERAGSREIRLAKGSTQSRNLEKGREKGERKKNGEEREGGNLDGGKKRAHSSLLALI